MRWGRAAHDRDRREAPCILAGIVARKGEEGKSSEVGDDRQATQGPLVSGCERGEAGTGHERLLRRRLRRGVAYSSKCALRRGRARLGRAARLWAGAGLAARFFLFSILLSNF